MSAATRSFTITRCLGRGGFGEVYRARMLRGEGLDADVALKVLRRDIDPDGQAVERLRDEGRLLARLNHPAILKVHDLVVLDERVALVTEYVDGDDLSRCLRGRGRIGTRALLQAVAVVAGALATAWESPGPDGPLHLVHRDIKPSNIRLSRHGDVKLLDFGIARTDAQGVERESRTRTGMMVGSPAYMAPERFTERTVHLGSDVFSLCAVLFEGCTGDRFYGDLPIPMQVGLAVDEERFATHLRAQLEKVPDTLRELLAVGLAHDPAARPHPRDLAKQLDALAEHERGSSLGQYTRERAWSDGEALAGELDGRTLTESLPGGPAAPSSVETLEQPAPLPPTIALPIEVSEPARRRRWPWVLAVLVGLTGLGLAALVALTGGLAALPYVLADGGAAAVVPDEDPELPAPSDGDPAPAPTPADSLAGSPPDSEPAPAPSPAPVERTRPARPAPAAAPPPASSPSPVTAPAPEPSEAKPTPTRPAPAPAPAPEPATPTGTVALSGGVVALLEGASGRHRLPGEVPVGTYRLQALFNGLDPVDVASVTVEAGAQLRVDCSASFTRCTVK